MTPEQALSQIEIAYAALAELQKADWLSNVHHKTPTDLADAIHYTNEVWARLESFLDEEADKIYHKPPTDLADLILHTDEVWAQLGSSLNIGTSNDATA